MPRSEKNEKNGKSARASANQGWLGRGVWRVANYYCPLQEDRFALDLWRILEGFPEGIYRSLIPCTVLYALWQMSQQGWLSPMLDVPMHVLSYAFAALGGMMTGFFISARFL
ncbi:hypothetical protein BJI67_07450 [Acidihalobacter aeolianus]|uniref:Uncharacterized protein n=1 Tax=Acidihalobacter aeolianus TaxID=2792603 RepID=A0A1D8K7L1_9GAMM|nr:hypothetical protein [Acidihalobacter aeolianus]AOV16920.1 hypothetical protein BJI67_07450 [Acidihalobacter aeolianus]